MANIKFGTGSLNLPTPAKVGRAVTILSAVLGVISMWLVSATYIPNQVSNVLASILTLFISVANVIKPFFGTDEIEHKKTVPVDQVTELKTEK